MNVSLKTKMVLAVSAVFVLAIALLVVLPLLYFTSEFKKSIGRQQFSLVTSLADNIDDKLRIAQGSLVAAAGQLPPEAATDPDAAQRFLDSRSSLSTVFDNALFLFSHDGRIIAESPYREGRRGRDISFRDYYQKTVASGKPHISSPYISTHNPGHPAIIITAPIYDAQNKLIAILAGSFDLLGENFLQELSRVKIGNTGYLYLYDDDRTMIVHPDKSRIMQRDVPLGANRLFDAAIKGFEGSGQTVNSRGLHVIASFKHLNTTNWIVGANYPKEEAYAPIRKIVDYILPAIFLGTAAMLALVWLLMDRMTAPLLAITAHVESLPVLNQTQKLITLPIGGEIGKLAQAFNGMMTDLDLQQEALRESELNFRALADNANDGMLIITGQAGLTYANRRAAEILSYDNAELLKISVMDLVFPDERHKVVERYAAVAAGERVPKQFEINLMSREGRRVPTEVTTARTVWRHEQAELVIVRDISERKQAEEDIQQLAYYDTLTGLPNRTLLHDRLRQMIAHAGRDGHTLGVMFLDLDRFKSINDSLGHLTGDLLLKGAGARLAAAVREADTVARLGGDEFVVVVSAVAHEEHLAKVADKIIALFDEPIVVDGQEIFTTCSIGIATFPNDGADASSLLKNADIAMYQAKDQGRNNYQFFSQEMNVKALEQMMLETSLRRALERQEFFLAYQPQVELPSGRVIGTEALLRWRHPELGVVAPLRFIPLAEETGLIIPIGEWVLRTACARNKEWLDRGARLRVAVNLSARQLNQPGFVELVADILRETGLPPEALELEVTESMIMTKNSSTMTVLTKLKEMGVGLAIDDFGTGYSSLSYLKHFPIDRIKIDRSFVRDIPANSDDTAISEAIIAMAHSLNLKVTAEGVEHQEQLHFLASRLCDEIQGFYFMPPVSAEEVEEVIFGGAPLRHAKSM